MIQSNAANVSVSAKRNVAPGAKRCAAIVSFGSFDLSWRIEKPKRRMASRPQMMK